MLIKKQNIFILSIIILAAIGLWHFPVQQLPKNSWHILVVFIITIISIMSSVMPIAIIALISATTLVLTHTMPIKEVLNGFASPISWLIVIAFFISKGFIKTNLGKRIAYYLIKKFGKSNIGLSYSLIFTEFLLSPLIPSTTARGGGIIYPIAKSLADEYSKAANHKSNTSKFLIAICFHTNVITCALFLTAMAANPLCATLAGSVGIDLTWVKWAVGTIVPGFVTLMLLPLVIAFLIPPEKKTNERISEQAITILKEMGVLSRKEVMMIVTFIIMLLLWIFGPNYGIDATTTGFIGFIILIVAQVVNWDEVIADKAAWETFIWFSILIMLSETLTKVGINKWMGDYIKEFAYDYKGITAVIFLTLVFFYSHYFFASATAHVTVLYMTFLIIMIEFAVPKMVAALGLAVLTNLSSGLTHYGINTAPIYYSSGYFSAKEWLKIGWVISTFNLVLWVIVAGVWWKMLGWW